MVLSKVGAAILAMGMSLMAAGSALGDQILRCEGKGGAWGATAEVYISLPSTDDGRLWLFKEPAPPVLVNAHVGMGRILVSIVAADKSFRTATFEHPFVVTRMPTPGNTILKGFYFITESNPTPWIVQADKSSKDRKFWMAGDGEQYIGACQ